MPNLEELLTEDMIYASRSDGAKMLAMKVQESAEGPIWEVLSMDKEGQVAKDGIITLDTDKQAIYRKTFTTDQLRTIANERDYIEWNAGFFPQRSSSTPSSLEEQNNQLHEQFAEQQNQLEEQFTSQREQIELLLADTKAQLDTMVQSAKRSIASRIGKIPQISPDEVEQQIKSTAAEIAQRTPNPTQKVIALQVELGGGTYRQVAEQSQLSFRLSFWLVIAGAVLFIGTMATVAIPFASGNTSLIGTVGTVATIIVETVAGLNFLYNKATRQLAEFQVYLDRINRASICYSMADDLDKKSKEQQELITHIIHTLLQDK